MHTNACEHRHHRKHRHLDKYMQEARMFELAEEATKNVEASIGETTVDGKG